MHNIVVYLYYNQEPPEDLNLVLCPLPLDEKETNWILCVR